MERNSGSFAVLPIVVLFLLSAWSTGCERRETPLVVYVSADEYVARPILDSFSRQSGIPVHMVGDTEATKTTGLVERLRAERQSPLADVFWSSEAFMTIQLAREDLLQPFQSEAVDDWFPRWRDPDGRWFGFSPRPRVLVYDPEQVDAGDVPTSLAALSDPRWRGQIAMADPRFGTTGGHLAALRAWYDDRDDAAGYASLLDGLSANGVRVLPGGNAAVVEEVRVGRALVGLTDADDVRAANRLGAQLEMHAVGPVDGVGTFMMPNTVALVSGSSHPRAGELVDFLLSADVARALAESVSGNVPLVPEVADDFPQLQVPDPMPVDLEQVASIYPMAVNQAVTALKESQADAAP
ncbi:MAG: extracellular solute-binding protein [Phycisphaerales bacterium]|nr:extracellular solute-binding protein [Phycisphaerales bacterium]